MKPIMKLSVLLLITFCSFGFARAQSSTNGIAQLRSSVNSVPQVQSPLIKIGVEIEIGHKPHPECPGFGFCKVKITIEKSSLSSGTAVYSDVDYSASSKSLLLNISRTDLNTRNPSKLQYFDNQTAVTFDTDEVLPDDVTAALGIYGVAVIKAGTYPLSYNAKQDMFTMSLRVVQSTD